jgi:hypothetical protein
MSRRYNYIYIRDEDIIKKACIKQIMRLYYHDSKLLQKHLENCIKLSQIKYPPSEGEKA